MGNRASGRCGLPHTKARRLKRHLESGTAPHEAARIVGCDRKTAARYAEKIKTGAALPQIGHRCLTCGLLLTTDERCSPCELEHFKRERRLLGIAPKTSLID
jgi:hypothetical protein